ncbi:MAG: GTPase HflX [Gammaproteobacteria bacterium]|nr:GTPase HflX [Gammaproteobacteria bacterium]
MIEFVAPNSEFPTLAVVVEDRTSTLSGSLEEEFLVLLDSVGLKGCMAHKLNLRNIHPKHLIGKGQLEKVLEIIETNDIKQLTINLDIDSRHQNSLTNMLGIPVYDRTAIILDVFARRARTYEGKIQVEMAQIQYASSRLVRVWTHLERQRSGIGMRGGPGEKQLELDRRMLRERNARLKKRLEKVKKQRNLSRSSRRKAGFTTISLVGYTNAGKSTLFNLLTASAAQSSNALFTTLDPTIRKVASKGGGDFLMADTVGFIESLSKDLLQSFAATFGEIQDSNLLLHVIDITDKGIERKQEAVEDLLEQLGASEIPTIMIYNKVDKSEDTSLPDISYDADGNPAAIWISAANQVNIDAVTKSIEFFVKQAGTYRSGYDATASDIYPADEKLDENAHPAGDYEDNHEDYESDYEEDNDNNSKESPTRTL